jgi:hypothetical protein
MHDVGAQFPTVRRGARGGSGALLPNRHPERRRTAPVESRWNEIVPAIMIHKNLPLSSI